MTLGKEAVSILRRVKRHILVEPKRIAMAYWRLNKDETPYAPEKGWPKCGTVACIGGWVETLYRQDHKRSQFKSARDILRISYDQANDLFHKMTLVDVNNQQTPTHARQVAKHIDAFIAKYR